MSDENDAAWHLDKRVNVAIIFAISAQAAALVWWGASINARVNHLERIEQDQAQTIDRLARLEVRQEEIKETVSRIDERLRNGSKK